MILVGFHMEEEPLVVPNPDLSVPSLAQSAHVIRKFPKSILLTFNDNFLIPLH